MSNLLQKYLTVQEYSKRITEMQRDVRREYEKKVVMYKDEEYEVLVIDITGRNYGYPLVKLQSVKKYGLGYVKGLDLSIEEFQKLL